MGNFVYNVDGTGKVNWKGVAYYNRLINYMLKIGIWIDDGARNAFISL
jgi:hypothetical protein